jgi:hypothetical protein
VNDLRGMKESVEKVWKHTEISDGVFKALDDQF